jgi:lipopolysaccharide transport system ATP-binding protein
MTGNTLGSTTPISIESSPPVATSDSDVVISVHNVGKMYRLYNRPQDRLKEQLLWRFGKHFGREFWALYDVSFEVQRGETIGIIGRNGSGKSTLLQIIAGTLTPTLGEVRIVGRVAALLELGSGFNPEFTGHENVFLNGSILGISPEEMEARYEEIVTFADIGEFIEQPVKLYSSGMVVRLAFAINALLDPDILIVDEALSVGDEGFQRKCYSWISTLRERGTTIFFVSHSMGTVANLCNRVILLDQGKIHLEGDAQQAVKEYHRLLFGSPSQSLDHSITSQRAINVPNIEPAHLLFDQDKLKKALYEGTQTDLVVTQSAFVDLSTRSFGPRSTNEKRYGNGEITINAVGLFNQDLESIYDAYTRQPVAIVLDITVNQQVFDYGFGFVIEDKLSNAQYSVSTRAIAKEHMPALHAGQQLQIAFAFTNLLLKGTYYLSCGAWRVENDQWYYYDRRVDVLHFEVLSHRLDVWGVADFGARIGMGIISQ